MPPTRIRYVGGEKRNYARSILLLSFRAFLKKRCIHDLHNSFKIYNKFNCCICVRLNQIQMEELSQMTTNCPNVSTSPITAMGYRQFLPLSKEIRQEELCYSTKILSFSFIWAILCKCAQMKTPSRTQCSNRIILSAKGYSRN